MDARHPTNLSSASPRPDRFKDRHLATVDEWRGGCVYCGAPESRQTLPGSNGLVVLPLCSKHVRWAMAARRERMGKQSRTLKRLVLAWCRLKGGDQEAAHEWLGF